MTCRCFACGMDDYMTKPLMMQDLRERLRAHHRTKRSSSLSSTPPLVSSSCKLDAASYS